MSMQDRNLGQDMHDDIVRLDVQQVRQCVRSILDSAVGRQVCFGGIFLDNVTYRSTYPGDKNSRQLTFYLGGPRNITQLLNRWNTDHSSNIAYIPPEEILGTGDRSKADTWAVGCLVIQLLNFGKPLKLRRKSPYASDFEYFELKEPEIIERLIDFYAGIGEERGLVVGPEITLDNVPRACEDFIAHCLDPVFVQRWSLETLRTHSFVDQSISLEQLYALDEVYYSTLPIVKDFTVNNLRPHPYLASSTIYSILVGNSPDVGTAQLNGTTVEVWKFQLLDEARDRDLYTRAYGKLLDLLTLQNSDDEAVRQRADCYRIRALQKGHQNIVHHYGCQFTPRPNSYSMPEFLVYSEHCAGGNFQRAAGFSLPLSVIRKWVGEVLRGLDFLHKYGIVHRNINSSIILFTDPFFKGTVKIGGFHNMRQLTGDSTQRHEISARHGQDGRFVAPEISNTRHDIGVGRKSDIWSFGCVVLHLVTGHPPLYRGQSGRSIDSEMAVIYHLNHQKKGPEIPDWVPDNVRAFIAACFQFDPELRPTAAELLQIQHALVFDEATATEYLYNRDGNTLPHEVIPYWTQVTESVVDLPGKEVFGRNCRYSYDRDNNEISRGAFGVVYRAKVTYHGDYVGADNVAIKSVRLDKGSEILTQQKTWLNLINKWKTLLNLTHENLVTYHKVTIDTRPNAIDVELMMDYYLGGDLTVLISKLTKDEVLLDPATAVRYALEITAGVAFLHEHHIIHCDLKPRNILVQQLDATTNRIVIGDLDEFVQMQRSVTSPTDITGLFGTVRYMSPEMLQTFVTHLPAPVPGRKTDIWSLGCILLELADCIIGNNVKWLRNSVETVEAGERMKDWAFVNLVAKGYVPVVSDAVPVGLRTCIANHCLLSESEARICAADLAKKLQDEARQYQATGKR